MTYLVISDTHGRYDLIEELLVQHGRVDGILFLGDGLADLKRLSAELPPVIAVRGNCDVWGADAEEPEERLLHLSEYTVLMMHGHRFGVKAGRDRAAAYAASRGADILLYGHTHLPEDRYVRTESGELLHLFNPGSLGAPREGRGSYGLLQIRHGEILLSHGTR